MGEIDYSIRTALPSDRSRLANLLHFGSYIHQHLDWKQPLDWIGSQPYLLLERQNAILATLACPPDLPKITWIRLFAVNNAISLKRAWNILWEATVNELSQYGGIKIAVISLQSWFSDLLEASKFTHSDDVIVLMWDGASISNPSTTDVLIRNMLPEDMETIQLIDHDAFGSLWENSREALELAYQQSSLASVAECSGEIVGYQFSTISSMGGHLARLAVKPEMQRRGIGYLLVHHVVKHYHNIRIAHVSVNTQRNNDASIALYTRAGFYVTGEAYRVYQYDL